MTIVNSWNEWDPLKHVIVGTVENSNNDYERFSGNSLEFGIISINSSLL